MSFSYKLFHWTIKSNISVFIATLGYLSKKAFVFLFIFKLILVFMPKELF